MFSARFVQIRKRSSSSHLLPALLPSQSVPPSGRDEADGDVVDSAVVEHHQGVGLLRVLAGAVPHHEGSVLEERVAVHESWDVTGTFPIWTGSILLCLSGSRLRRQSYGHTRLRTRACYARLPPGGGGKQTLGFNNQPNTFCVRRKSTFSGSIGPEAPLPSAAGTNKAAVRSRAGAPLPGDFT